MKPLQSWTVVIGFVISLMVLGGYAYNISAYAATLEEKQKGQQRQFDELKDDQKYIRQRVDEIYNILRQNNCGQCKDH
jgi:type VI protein secretion system component VasK